MPDYATAALSCEIQTLSGESLKIQTSALAVIEKLKAIIATLQGLSGAGAWLGSSQVEAENLLAVFDQASAGLFGERPLGVISAISANLRRAALNYDAAETEIAEMFAQFVGEGGAETTPGGGTTTPGSVAPNPVTLTET